MPTFKIQQRGGGTGATLLPRSFASHDGLRVRLKQESEPEIWNAIRFGSILENVVFDEYTREVDFMSKCDLASAPPAFRLFSSLFGAQQAYHGDYAAH